MKARSQPARSDWPALAGALARRLAVDALHPAALAALRAQPPTARIAVACSGGADSLALLLLLWAHLPECRGRWVVLHFNHRLRGAEADADATFVRSVARGLGEKCAVGTWHEVDTRSGGDSPTVSEAAARAARHTFFNESMARARARVLALGHQRDDVAETMLMRLARGSGSGGLAAPRPLQAMPDGGVRVRPLLGLTAADLREALREVGAPWREDASNAGGAYFRNRVRHDVLPELVAASPTDALAGIAWAREQLQEDDEALEAQVDELVGTPRAGLPFDLTPLRGRPRALIRRAVHRWLLAEGLSEVLGRPAVQSIVAALASGTDRRQSAGAAGFVHVSRGALVLRKRPSAAPGFPPGIVRPGSPWTGPRGDRLEMRLRRLTRPLYAAITAAGFSCAGDAFLSADSVPVGQALEVRPRRPGDRYRPLGAPGRMKLQDLFVNRKIPRDQRDIIPVICREDGTILWVPGLPPATECAVQPGGKAVVQLTYICPGNIVPL